MRPLFKVQMKLFKFQMHIVIGGRIYRLLIRNGTGIGCAEFSHTQNDYDE